MLRKHEAADGKNVCRLAGFRMDGLFLEDLVHHDLDTVGHLAAGFGLQAAGKDRLRAIGAALRLVGRRNVLEIAVGEFDDDREFRGRPMLDFKAPAGEDFTGQTDENDVAALHDLHRNMGDFAVKLPVVPHDDDR